MTFVSSAVLVLGTRFRTVVPLIDEKDTSFLSFTGQDAFDIQIHRARFIQFIMLMLIEPKLHLLSQGEPGLIAK